MPRRRAAPRLQPRQEQQLARGPPGGEVVLRPGGVGQRVGAADPHVELALGDPVEHLAGAPPQLRRVGDVVHQGRPGQEQRSAGVQPLRVDRRHLPAGGSVEHHHAARAQRRQAVVERVLADAVVHHVRARALGRIVDDGTEAVVADDVIGAGAERELGLLAARGGGHDDAAAPLHHLGQQQTDPAGRRVHHGDVAFAHRVGAGDQVVRGHALQDGGGGDLQAHPVRNRDDPVRGQRDLLGVAAARAGPGHVIADRQAGDALPHGRDRTSAFRAGHEGRIGAVVAHSLTLVDVHVVDAGRGDLHDHLPWSRPRLLLLGEPQHLGAAQTLAHYHAHPRTLLSPLPHQLFTSPHGPGPSRPALSEFKILLIGQPGGDLRGGQVGDRQPQQRRDHGQGHRDQHGGEPAAPAPQHDEGHRVAAGGPDSPEPGPHRRTSRRPRRGAW